MAGLVRCARVQTSVNEGLPFAPTEQIVEIVRREFGAFFLSMRIRLWISRTSRPTQPCTKLTYSLSTRYEHHCSRNQYAPTYDFAHISTPLVCASRRCSNPKASMGSRQTGYREAKCSRIQACSSSLFVCSPTAGSSSPSPSSSSSWKGAVAAARSAALAASLESTVTCQCGGLKMAIQCSPSAITKGSVCHLRTSDVASLGCLGSAADSPLAARPPPKGCMGGETSRSSLASASRAPLCPPLPPPPPPRPFPPGRLDGPIPGNCSPRSRASPNRRAAPVMRRCKSSSRRRAVE
mmetsp:Transcript_56685/g.147656  ORF Transcript_56685/g.147656 Transcript_56685/m.147656 type:complete len:294 (-) Transcript_56685:307-1188(-)